MRIETRTLALLGLIGAVGLAACGTDDADDRGAPVDSVADSGDTSADAADDPALMGDWLVDELTVDGVPIALDPSRSITVTFDDGTIGGTAACNHFGGSVDVSAGPGNGTFVVSDLSWTEMGCEPEIMDIEQAFLSALLAVDSYEVADGLYVAAEGGGTNFHLVRAEPIAPTPFTGTTWVLDTYLEDETASNSPGMADVWIRFDDDGVVHGATGCAGITGEWVLDGTSLSFTRLDRVEIPAAADCEVGAADLDSLVLDVLEGLELTMTIDGQRMTIEARTRGGDRAGLSWQPGEAGADVDSFDMDATGLLPGGGVDGPVMYAARSDGDDGMAAEILGTLELDGDCLYTTFEGNRYPVLWPYGTTWDDDSESVVLPDGEVIALGSEVYGGGGYLYADALGGFTDDETVLERAAQCAEEPYFEIAVMQYS